MTLPPENPDGVPIDKAVEFATEAVPEGAGREKGIGILNDLARDGIPLGDGQDQVVEVPGADEPLKRFDLMLKNPMVPKAVPIALPAAVPGYRKKARRWTKEEDDRLAAAVQVHGTENWPLVATYVGGDRTRSQCSQRWHRCIDPKIEKCNWSREEEQKLIEAVQSHGNKAWTRIAAEMGNRSDVQCRFRYKFLLKKAKEMGTDIQPISAPMAVTHAMSTHDQAHAFVGHSTQDEQDQPPVMPEAKDAAPDFPVHSYFDLQKSRLPPGDTRAFHWQTTYRADWTPKERDANAQALDTAKLQATHWTAGDLPGTTISEMHDKYRKLGNAQRETALTRDQMMRTSFELGDGSPMESRVLTRSVTAIPPRSNLREQMVATHFDLKNPAEPSAKWQSTNRHDFRALGGKPSDPADITLNRGIGAKSTFDNMRVFGPTRSLDHDTYVAHTNQGVPQNRTVTLSGDTITFQQDRTNKWRRTNWQVGDSQGRYETTSGADLQAPKSVAYPDPNIIEERKRLFARSYVGAGNNFPTVTESTAHAAVKPHPGFQPPPMAERTAFQSHHDFRNSREGMSTTSRDAYQPRKYQPVEIVDHKLQETHAKFGDDAINEKTSLYTSSYQKPAQTMERADMQAARDFHMGHHANNKTGEVDRTGESIYTTSFTGCKGGKASDICDALRGGKNIVPNDPRFNVTKSSMKADYVHHKKAPLPEPIDNALQQSHIRMQTGMGGQWQTTQQDYFQFQTYKMPGSEF